jgi:hypothetical protein
LGFVFHAAEGGREDEAVAIALEVGAHRGFGAGGLADAVGGEELVPVHARVLVKAAMIAHWRERMAGGSDGCWGCWCCRKNRVKNGEMDGRKRQIISKGCSCFFSFLFFLRFTFFIEEFL